MCLRLLNRNKQPKKVKTKFEKGIESLPQTQIFESFYFFNLMDVNIFILQT